MIVSARTSHEAAFRFQAKNVAVRRSPEEDVCLFSIHSSNRLGGEKILLRAVSVVAPGWARCCKFQG